MSFLDIQDDDHILSKRSTWRTDPHIRAGLNLAAAMIIRAIKDSCYYGEHEKKLISRKMKYGRRRLYRVHDALECQACIAEEARKFICESCHDPVVNKMKEFWANGTRPIKLWDKREY